MKLHSLSVKDFKNAENEKIVFTDGVNVIYGDNAAGKTNLLEAIFLFATGKSFRGSKDKDFIRFGQDTASIEIEFEEKSGTQKMGIRLYKNQKKQIFRSGVQVTKLSEYLGLFRAVIFTPDHLNSRKGFARVSAAASSIWQSASHFRGMLPLSACITGLSRRKNAFLKNKIDSDELLEVTTSALPACFEFNAEYRYKYNLPGSKRCGSVSVRYDRGKPKRSRSNTARRGEGFESVEEIRKRFAELSDTKKEHEKQKGNSLYGRTGTRRLYHLHQCEKRTSFRFSGQQRSACVSLKLAEVNCPKSLQANIRFPAGRHFE
jgi:recombinational DNA repair ATPase RecF